VYGAFNSQPVDLVDKVPEQGFGDGLAGFDTEGCPAASDGDEGGQGPDWVGDLLAGVNITA